MAKTKKPAVNSLSPPKKAAINSLSPPKKAAVNSLSPPKKAAVNSPSLPKKAVVNSLSPPKKAVVNSLSPLSSDRKIIKTKKATKKHKPTPTSVGSVNSLSPKLTPTTVAQTRSISHLSLSSDEEHDISSRSATSIAQTKSVGISFQPARYQPTSSTSFTQTRSVNSLSPLSSGREHENQQSWRNIDEILAVQRQQEHSISTMENALNNILASLESLNSKIDSLSRARSQRGLEVGETSAAAQQRPQFKNERKRKNALR
ncbi:6633_t:CDS:2, partial [Dentiscutata heterogama]